jgi:hypothetical protein
MKRRKEIKKKKNRKGWRWRKVEKKREKKGRNERKES